MVSSLEFDFARLEKLWENNLLNSLVDSQTSQLKHFLTALMASKTLQ